jgi:TRAP-type C4-dicarboxylate transport system substrate-binding protein
LKLRHAAAVLYITEHRDGTTSKSEVAARVLLAQAGGGDMRKIPTALFAALWTAVLAIAAAGVASAEEVTLKAITSFAEKTLNSRQFERFIDIVNEKGKGKLRIDYIGGPKAMPPFEVGNALKNGVVDIANVTGAFYTNVFPESDAWKLTQRSMAELRKNGGVDYMQKLYDEKMNAVYLARQIGNTPFHIYLAKPITKPDLTGLKLRITPVYREFFQALGATVVQTAPGEVYTALERGVVDGYGWPTAGIFDLGWHEKTKYRVDPGFYTAEVSFLVNKTTWGRLDADQRKIIADTAAEIEAGSVAFETKENDADVAKQKQVGIETIAFKGAEAEAYLAKAYDAAWAGIIAKSPVHGPKLRELFSKPK